MTTELEQYTSPWLYQGQVVDSVPQGIMCFVYLITNKLTGRMYVGLKQTVFSKTKQVKGKKKKVKVESDWREYWSSSEELKKDVELLGQDNFQREILFWCKSKSHANYLEAREQMDRRVLEESDKYYNGIINCRVNRKHIQNITL